MTNRKIVLYNRGMNRIAVYQDDETTSIETNTEIIQIDGTLEDALKDYLERGYAVVSDNRDIEAEIMGLVL